MLETKTVDTSGPFAVTPRLRYQLDSHLGSASLDVDGEGLVIGYYEEYHPYGTTAYRSTSSAAEVNRKRYRYTGKEKDEETGLYYHGARYYAPWLGRWTSADSAGMVDGPNLYSYVSGNPVGMIDPSGMAGDEPNYGLESLQHINTVNAADLGLKVATEEDKKAQLAEAKKTPVKVTKAPALPVQEIRPEHPLAGDMEKVRRAAELSSIPPDQKERREAAARHLRYGPVEAVLVEGEAAKERIEAEIESLEAKDASIHGDAIKIQMALERQGVLPPRLTGPKGAIIPGPIERDPAGGYRPVPTAGPSGAGVGGLVTVRGTLTETAPAGRGERSFAQEFFVSKGYDVRLAGLGTEGADLNVSVGGVPIGRFELKQQTTGNPSNVAKRIRKALRQAPNAIVDLRQSPLSNVGAISGYREAARKGWVPQGATVRPITPNMDITFGRR